ncbi:MAG: aminotransferase class V-fold PLP-dependent enzyme [Oscillospiraceae bacterium]|nr:aminotransferase class V-fold PLP-dependent enzyme [Oscillospiraceae bacterium]
MTCKGNRRKKDKKHIISTAFEHHAVLHTLKRLENQGFEVTLITPERNGIISIGSVKNTIREDTALVTIIYANNEIGTIKPIAEIGTVCRENGVLFHTDAVQAAVGEQYQYTAADECMILPAKILFFCSLRCCCQALLRNIKYLPKCFQC